MSQLLVINKRYNRNSWIIVGTNLTVLPHKRSTHYISPQNPVIYFKILNMDFLFMSFRVITQTSMVLRFLINNMEALSMLFKKHHMVVISLSPIQWLNGGRELCRRDDNFLIFLFPRPHYKYKEILPLHSSDLCVHSGFCGYVCSSKLGLPKNVSGHTGQQAWNLHLW